MNFPNPKELQKLAMACRKAGIKSFKCADFEFNLTDELPVSPKKRAAMPLTSDTITTTELSEEALLFWSAGVTDEAQGA